jgi:hypothetical protein
MAGTRQVARSTAVAALVAHHTGRKYLISTPFLMVFDPNLMPASTRPFDTRRLPTLVETHPCYLRG